MRRQEKKMVRTTQSAPSVSKGEMSVGNIMVEIALFFLGLPYRSGTLEQPGRERLAVNLTQFDCTTFVETVLALTLCAEAGTWSVKSFRKNLRMIRYRHGQIAGYASRLHYFIDWLSDNEKKKIVRNVSRWFNGKPRRKKMGYMTAHHDVYAGLKNDEQIRQMKQVEKKLSRRIFYAVDWKQNPQWTDGLQPGDVLAFTTDADGLDVAHVGFAVKIKRHWHLLHASSREGRVVLSKETLQAYLKTSGSYSAIIVARFYFKTSSYH